MCGVSVVRAEPGATVQTVCSTTPYCVADEDKLGSVGRGGIVPVYHASKPCRLCCNCASTVAALEYKWGIE